MIIVVFTLKILGSVVRLVNVVSLTAAFKISNKCSLILIYGCYILSDCFAGIINVTACLCSLCQRSVCELCQLRSIDINELCRIGKKCFELRYMCRCNLRVISGSGSIASPPSASSLTFADHHCILFAINALSLTVVATTHHLVAIGRQILYQNSESSWIHPFEGIKM